MKLSWIRGANSVQSSPSIAPQRAIPPSSILPVAQVRLLNYGVPANLVTRWGPLWARQFLFLFTLFFHLPGNTLLLRTCVPPRVDCSKLVPTSGRRRYMGPSAHRTNGTFLDPSTHVQPRVRSRHPLNSTVVQLVWHLPIDRYSIEIHCQVHNVIIIGWR